MTSHLTNTTSHPPNPNSVLRAPTSTCSTPAASAQRSPTASRARWRHTQTLAATASATNTTTTSSSVQAHPSHLLPARRCLPARRSWHSPLNTLPKRVSACDPRREALSGLVPPVALARRDQDDCLYYCLSSFQPPVLRAPLSLLQGLGDLTACRVTCACHAHVHVRRPQPGRVIVLLLAAPPALSPTPAEHPVASQRLAKRWSPFGAASPSGLPVSREAVGTTPRLVAALSRDSQTLMHSARVKPTVREYQLLRSPCLTPRRPRLSTTL